MNKNFIYFINNSLLKLPTPINISYWWNFGSLLGIFLIIQIIRGFFLSIHYCPNTNFAFNRIIHIIQNVKLGWLIHNIHINGASIFFICIYIHIRRGLYYNSFKLYNTWLIGVSIYLLSIATAFLGYVLPWGQISFWGATVITNLVSTIPYIGNLTVQWIWGGFSINNATLNRLLNSFYPSIYYFYNGNNTFIFSSFNRIIKSFRNKQKFKQNSFPYLFHFKRYFWFHNFHFNIFSY